MQLFSGHLFISAEVGPLLCPSCASSGRWDRSNFIDYAVDAVTKVLHDGKPWSTGREREADLSGQHAPSQIMSMQQPCWFGAAIFVVFWVSW